MGVVYRGKDPFIGRTVAIKTITGNFTDNPDLLERFYREARAAGGLQHPNIVTIYDMGEDSGTPYIAMELLEGDDLGQMVDKERGEGGTPLPASIKLSYIVQVCRALEYAHKRNIVHRDIKPGNIVVTHEGTVKVVDFGIARLTDTSSTSSGMLIGTIDYMSPEQIRGEKVDGRSDIWAVGVMMYEILTYTKPFQGGNITAVMFAIVSQEPKSIRDLRPDLPPELDDVVRRIFKKEPGERYQNMEELLGELEPVARKMQQESVGVLVTQSESLLNQGDLQRAKELLKQALVLDTSHMHAKTLLDKVNSAIRMSEVAPKLNAMVANAEKMFESGNLEDARREADAALHMDSNFAPARELLGKLQEKEMQLKMVQTGMREARQHLAEGSLTEAEQSLERVLKTAPDTAEAQSLRSQIAEEKERRGKRKQLADGVQKARQLWTAQQFDEALTVLAGLEKDFPGEAEVAKLLDAVKADKAQDEIQRALAEARKQLGAQSFNEALATLDKLLQRYPNESAAVKLRELVLEERSEHAKQLRLQKELESLKRQVNEEKFADAISNGEALLKEFPDDFELGRLIEFAKTQRAQQDVLKRRQSRHQEVNNLVQDSNFDAAIKACQDALKDFPGDAEFKQRLEQITTQQKEAKNRERQKLLDDRLRAMKQSIERGDLTGAIDIGNRTVVQTGKDTDLTKLMEMAKQERSIRDLRRKHDEQTLRAIDLLEEKKFEEAAKILRVLERDDILDPRVASLMRAAEDKRVPAKEDLALMRSKPVQGPEGEAGEGDKTRVGGIGGLGKPSPVATPSGDVGGATRVFRPGGDLGEETIKSKTPLVAPSTAAPTTVGINAAAVAPPAPVEEKTTIVPPAIGETTVVAPPKTKEEKKKQKEREREQEQERERERQREKEKDKGKKVETPVAAATTTAVTPPAAPAKPEPKPEIKQPVAPAPAPPAPPKPAVQPSASVAAPVKEAPPKPAAEERKEAPAKTSTFDAVAAPAPKKGGMGMIIAGGVAVVVLAVGGYMIWGRGGSSSQPQPPEHVEQPQPNKPEGNPGKVVEPPPPPAGPPATVVKQFDALMAEASKDITNKKYDEARKVAEKVKTFVSQNNLPVEYARRSDGLPEKIANAEKNAANAAFQANLKQSNELFAKIGSEVEGAQYPSAEQDIQALDAIGEGNAHKDDVAALRNKIQQYKAEDARFSGAQSQLNSNERGTLISNKAILDQIAANGGRHADQARSLSGQFASKISAITKKEEEDAINRGAAEKKAKVAQVTSDVRRLIGANDFAGARAKLSEMPQGESTSSLNSEIDAAEKSHAAAQRSAQCQVLQVTHEKWTNPFNAGVELNQAFLDADLQLNAGANCGLPSDVLQAAGKGTEARLQVMIDTNGSVTDGQFMAGYGNAGAGAVAAAKSNWHFTPPKVNGKSVKTRATVAIHFK